MVAPLEVVGLERAAAAPATLVLSTALAAGGRFRIFVALPASSCAAAGE